MAIHAPRNYLLAYDIADPDRLGRVHRTVRRWGIPLQYSVFLVPATAVAIAELAVILGRIIERREDDIRIYPLPNHLDMHILGRQGLPQGIQLTDASEVGFAIECLVSNNKPQ